MYTWTLLVITVGVVVPLFQILLFIGLFIKVRNRKDNGVIESSDEKPTKSVCVTDPFTGKLVNLERVSNASSLRSSKSIGFISYTRPESSQSRARVTPIFGNGSINSEKLNRSMASPSRSIDSELKPENVNPLFEKETSPEIKLGKMRAREI